MKFREIYYLSCGDSYELTYKNDFCDKLCYRRYYQRMRYRRK